MEVNDSQRLEPFPEALGELVDLLSDAGGWRTAKRLGFRVSGFRV